MHHFNLRPYQQEALDSIPESGAFVICLFTGAGKTVCMSQIPRRGRMLILSHRDELVHQPEKYFDCSFGVEQASETSHGEEIVSASVQSLVRRLDKFKPDDFDVLVTDECFIGSTLVDGIKIQDIEVGDHVTAYNHELSRFDMRKVLRKFVKPMPEKLIKINYKIICTLNHPFYEIGNDCYIPAYLLKLGDRLFLRVNEEEVITSLELIEPSNENKFVYNLEVEGLNNYFANGYLVHNCHHATAPTYRKIYDYFNPRLHLGFTATPNRNDGIGLKDIYQDIIFERDLRWGIENKYLSPLQCLRVDIGYDLSRVALRLGDYASEALEKAVNIEKANKALAEVYQTYAKPPCLIFCASVAHAENLAKLIDGAVAVKGGEDRSEIVEAFSRGEIPCLTNCMIFTEGTDLPNIQTVIMARPTKNVSLYTQMVGRSLRLYPGKEYATLIDCVGAGDEADLCTAPSLLGLDINAVPPTKRSQLQGNLFDLLDIAYEFQDTPEAWIRNVYYVDLWAKRTNYNLHGVNFFRKADGSLSVMNIVIPPEDTLGRVKWRGRLEPTQKVIDEVYQILRTEYADKQTLWDKEIVKKWGKAPATEKQRAIVRRIAPLFDTENLTKFEATQILQGQFAPAPATQKQIYFLQCRGVDTFGLTKQEASRLIAKIKERK
ncbi:MAG: DEAD/DEAH box helicase family protein [Synergistaceae bacterium]|nr:DEAD/DEAH box helicase family protein [Synergistaceae bacterium]